MTLVRVDDLSVDIHDTAILRGVSLEVEAGKITAITGESGSGKSMTAFSIAGLLPRTAMATGHVSLNGKELLGLDDPAMCKVRGKDIGVVFQEPMTALNPVQTIGDQVAETILIHGAMPRAAALDRAAEVLERVGLPNDQFPLDRYPHQLSGGQRQRVVIAMAIALRPKLLIADEPTTALDVTTQAQVLDLLKGLVAEFDMGLLMITHDLAVVSAFADQIVVMKDGAVVEAAATDDLLRNMTHPYTKALFAASVHAVALPPIKESTALLEVRGVTRSYKTPRKSMFERPGRFVAVDDVSFSLAHGERLGLVGESGCGKSTLTRAILGLEDVQAGTITLDGAPVFTGKRPNRDVRRKMQVVFQDPYGSFNPRHRVSRLVAEPFHLSDTPPKGADLRQLIETALTDVGLQASDADKFIHEFSGGQRQRIAIARALIAEPDLIIFDEAVSALDVSVRAQVLDLLAALCRKRTFGYLFISHDLSVVRTITDRVLVMQRGKIVEDGLTQQVFDNPTHPYTQTLLAAVPTLPDLSK